jgi:multicomponent Na+:H+ antiporter subunit C
MIWLLALTVFVCITAGDYLALSRDVFRCVLGLGVLGAAANLVLFASG